MHGNKTYLLQNTFGQVEEAHSISAGLVHPGIGPEHSFLLRIKSHMFLQKKALNAFKYCCKGRYNSNFRPAHALSVVKKIAPKMKSNEIIVMNMCGKV